MDKIEPIINNMLYTLVRYPETWETLTNLINNKSNNILSFCVNNFAKIVLSRNNTQLDNIITLKIVLNNNKSESLDIIINKVKEINKKKKNKR